MTVPDTYGTSRIHSVRVSINTRYQFLGELCNMQCRATSAPPHGLLCWELMLIGEWFRKDTHGNAGSGLWQLVHGNIAAISANAILMAPGVLLSLHGVLLDDMINCLRTALRARCIHCILCLSPSFSQPACPGPVVLSMFNHVLQLLATSHV